MCVCVAGTYRVSGWGKEMEQVCCLVRLESFTWFANLIWTPPKPLVTLMCVCTDCHGPVCEHFARQTEGVMASCFVPSPQGCGPFQCGGVHTHTHLHTVAMFLLCFFPPPHCSLLELCVVEFSVLQIWVLPRVVDGLRKSESDVCTKRSL